LATQPFTEWLAFPDSADQRTGDVAYVIDGKQALLDVGQKIHLLDRREATLLAGLEMGVRKIGVQLERFGTDGQKRQSALAAAKHRICEVYRPDDAGGRSAGVSNQESSRPRDEAIPRHAGAQRFFRGFLSAACSLTAFAGLAHLADPMSAPGTMLQ
jgi:2-methylaconitate cis-trans-isomerase PrpF